MSHAAKMLTLLLLCAPMAFGQNSTQPQTPHTGSAPDAYALSGHFDRIVIVRLKYQTDLLAGLQAMVKQQRIRNGVILAGIGSVRGYHLHVVSNRTFPSQDTYVSKPEQPADLVSMNGYVVNGTVHPHMTLSTPESVIAGHLEPGTQVFTFVIVTIGVMNHTDFGRLDDESYR